MQAIILAGGRGARMRPFTDHSPKPMVPVLGKPLIAHQIGELRDNGITDISIYESYLPKVIQEYLGDGFKLGVKIEHRVVDFSFGSAGVVKDALRRSQEENILVHYGDIFSDIEIAGLISHHLKDRSYATIAMLERNYPYGVARAIGHTIISFEEKPTWYENTGVMVVAKELERWLPSKGDLSKEIERLGNNKKGLEFQQIVHEGFWWDVRSLEVAEEIEGHFRSQEREIGEYLPSRLPRERR